MKTFRRFLLLLVATVLTTTVRAQVMSTSAPKSISTKKTTA